MTSPLPPGRSGRRSASVRSRKSAIRGSAGSVTSCTRAGYRPRAERPPRLTIRSRNHRFDPDHALPWPTCGRLWRRRPDIAVGTVERPAAPDVRAPAQPRAPRRRSGGGVIFLPPWTRAPFLPFKQPAVILAVLGRGADPGLRQLVGRAVPVLGVVGVAAPAAGRRSARTPATRPSARPRSSPTRPAARPVPSASEDDHRPIGDDRGRPRRPLPGAPGRPGHPGGRRRPGDRRPDLLPGRRDQPDHPGRAADPVRARASGCRAGMATRLERDGRVAGVVLDLRRGPGGAGYRVVGIYRNQDAGAGPAVLVLVHEPVPEPELRQRLGTRRRW